MSVLECRRDSTEECFTEELDSLKRSFIRVGALQAKLNLKTKKQKESISVDTENRERCSHYTAVLVSTERTRLVALEKRRKLKTNMRYYGRAMVTKCIVEP